MRRGRSTEATVFDGLQPETVVCPELIKAYEETLARVDEDIAKLHKTRAAWVRLIHQAKARLGK